MLGKEVFHTVHSRVIRQPHVPYHIPILPNPPFTAKGFALYTKMFIYGVGMMTNTFCQNDFDNDDLIFQLQEQ